MKFLKLCKQLKRRIVVIKSMLKNYEGINQMKSKKDLVDISTTKLNEFALSLINISELYEKNLNSVKMICLLDDTLKIQFRDMSLIVFNTFKYIAYLEYESILNQRATFRKVRAELKNSFPTRKTTSYKTLAFIILEIIILLNDSIENDKISKNFMANFIKTSLKLHIFEKNYLKTNSLKKIVAETFNIKKEI